MGSNMSSAHPERDREVTVGSPERARKSSKLQSPSELADWINKLASSKDSRLALVEAGAATTIGCMQHHVARYRGSRSLPASYPARSRGLPVSLFPAQQLLQCIRPTPEGLLHFWSG
jgi:hypothetical protein